MVGIDVSFLNRYKTFYHFSSGIETLNQIILHFLIELFLQSIKSLKFWNFNISDDLPELIKNQLNTLHRRQLKPLNLLLCQYFKGSLR